jgi:hypothetical protein
MNPRNPDDLEQFDQAIQAEMPALLEQDRRRHAALQENNISGQLRRVISGRRMRYEELARQAGISFEQLAEFMAGDAPLPSTAIDRLASLVHHQLVPTE